MVKKEILRFAVLLLLVLVVVSCGSKVDEMGTLPAATSSTTTTTSTLGTSWLTRSSGTTENLHGVAWSPSLSMYAAVGANSTILISTNGTTWTVPTTITLAGDYTAAGGTAVDFLDVAWAGGRFVAVGTGDVTYGAESVIFLSTDGDTWTQVALASIPISTGGGGAGYPIYGVAYDGYAIVAAATQGNMVRSINGGANWSEPTGYPSYTDNYNSVRWTGSLFVAVGNLGGLVTSPDGNTWTTRTSGATASFPLNCVAGSPTAIATLGGSSIGGGSLSTNGGLTWTFNGSFLSSMVPMGMDYIDGKFIAVGMDGGGNGYAGASNDGNAWSSSMILTGPAQGLMAVAGHGEVLGVAAQAVAVGDGGLIMTSQ